ncbi:MAG: pirin family protein [Bacteroidetes bacterium]|nr:pirin family protein [Bacteroidota bacterium]
MKTVFHSAESRGFADHGWLKSHHTFSFAGYYHPGRMNFGALRVLNDDIVAAGMGFGTHPHDNMEIISIPLEGDLEHRDSMGNLAVIRNGDIQVMSAGTGIRHSEYNKNTDQPVKFLQIWVIPDQRNVNPRYDQVSLDPKDRHNRLQQIASPDPTGDGVWFHQQAWFFLGQLDRGFQETYTLKKPGNGIYFFVLSGKITLAGQELSSRDGLGVWETSEVHLTAESESSLLIMEVPML